MINTKKLLYILFIITIASTVSAQDFRKGDLFPLEKLRLSFSGYQSAFIPDASLLVFLPSLSDSCLYANALRLSFENYFAQGFALGNSLKTTSAASAVPKVQLVFISPEALSPASIYYSHSADFVTLPDESLELFSLAGIMPADSANADAVLFVIDKMGKVAYRNDHYRARGTQLKTVENELKKLLKLPVDFLPIDPAPSALQIGAAAPDFALNDGKMLSELWQKKPVLLSFYPAAFGGIIPQNPNDTLPEPSCAAHLLALSSLALPENKKGKKERLDAELVAVTSSTLDLLYLWETELGTQDLRFANDPNYAAAQAYQAYNPDGYNRTCVFIIDTNGNIIHLDYDFKANPQSINQLRQILKNH